MVRVGTRKLSMNFWRVAAVAVGEKALKSMN